MLKKKSEKAAIISKEHEEYLKSIKKERNFIRITQILIFVFGIIFWETAAQKNIIDTFLTSSPGAIPVSYTHLAPSAKMPRIKSLTPRLIKRPSNLCWRPNNKSAKIWEGIFAP